MSDSRMTKPGMRRGWGLRPEMCIAKSEEAHHTHHHHGAGTRPCATNFYASSPSRSAQNQPLRNASKQAKLHTDLDHAIATCFTRIGHVRFPHEEARPATRLGAPVWDAHRYKREAHHTPHYHGA